MVHGVLSVLLLYKREVVGALEMTKVVVVLIVIQDRGVQAFQHSAPLWP